MAKKSNKREQDSANDLEEKVLYINRCATVKKGGRQFSFSALILVGDGAGQVGLGFAKANEVSEAIRKGGEMARKNLFRFELDGETIPHEVFVKWDGAKILLKPAPEGTGVTAGSQLRLILEIGGVKNVTAKSLGSNNPLNQAHATIKALAQLRNREKTLAERSEDQ